MELCSCFSLIKIYILNNSVFKVDKEISKKKVDKEVVCLDVNYLIRKLMCTLKIMKKSRGKFVLIYTSI